jgi:hypothetical protein
MAALLSIEYREENGVLKDTGIRLFYCPACKCCHWIDAGWTVSGPPEAPTVRPSVLVNRRGFDHYVPKLPTCHLFITEGKIQYLSDSSHELAGKIVPMEPI